MRSIGFCTGAVARGDFRRGLRILAARHLTAVEISAHRVPELADLVAFLAAERPASFQHVSVHAPTGFVPEQEAHIVDLLVRHVPPDWPIIIHPDGVSLDAAWRSLGRRACFENMDKSKPRGRTCEEMTAVFERFPEASFCADIGHARQIDPSMDLAERLLTTFRDRLREIHCSEVDPSGVHHRVGRQAQAAFHEIAHLIPLDVPIILETDLAETDIEHELQTVRDMFCG